MLLIDSILNIFLQPYTPTVYGETPKQRFDREYSEMRYRLIKQGVLPADIVPCIESVVCTTESAIETANNPKQYTYEEPIVKNIAKTKYPLRWWPCDRPDLPAPSPAEQLIIDELNRYHIVWYREVSFEGLQVNSWSYPRYDIMLIVPHSPAGIVIIEYDGKMAHRSADRKAMDRLKTRFCKQYSIPLHRWSTSEYYHLHTCVQELMVSLGVALMPF